MEEDGWRVGVSMMSSGKERMEKEGFGGDGRKGRWA